MNNLRRGSLLISAYALWLSGAGAQITITRADVDSILAPGRNIPTITDSSLTSVDIGTEGSLTNTWNFSMLATSSFQVLHSVAAAATPWFVDFPGATNAFRLDTTIGSITGSIHQYLQASNRELRNMGAKGRATGIPLEIRTFTTPSELVYHLPATVGTTWGTSFTNRTLVTLSGGTLSDVSHTHNARYWIDAAGTMSLPGSAPPVFALRIRKINFYDNSPVGGYLFLSKGGALVQVETYDTTTTTGTILVTRGKTVWNHSIVPGQEEPVPVQMASFTGCRINAMSVRLDWRTISEINNYGFYVMRKRAMDSSFIELPNSFIAGYGTTNEPHDYTFIDYTAAGSALHYRLKQLDLDGAIHHSEPIIVSALTNVKEATRREFSLQQNYPNPFNPSTEMKFSVERTDRAVLELYNTLGQKVATLFDDVAEAGQCYGVRVAGDQLASGVYIYRLRAGSRRSMKKMILAR